MPSLDWHDLKNFKDFLNASLFLLKQLNSTKSTRRIRKQFHFSKENLHDLYLYIQTVSLKCSSHVWHTFDGAMESPLCCLMFLSFFMLHYVYAALKTVVNVVKMWKQMTREWSGRSSNRTVRQRRVAIHRNIHRLTYQNVLSFVLMHANDLFLYLNLKKLNLRDQIISPCALKYHADQPVWR